jgi:UDP-N-acetyl-D-glucosamine dehydrogenase
MRESPALDVMMLLMKRGAKLTYSDPHVPFLHLEGGDLTAMPEDTAAVADCAVIITDHTAFDYRGLLERSPLIVDTRNALKGYSSAKIVRL